jgi:TolA-binding protein
MIPGDTSTQVEEQEEASLGRQMREMAKFEVAPADGLARLRARIAVSVPLPTQQPTTPPSKSATLPTVAAASTATTAYALVGLGGLLIGIAIGAIGTHWLEARTATPLRITPHRDVPVRRVMTQPPAPNANVTATANSNAITTAAPLLHANSAPAVSTNTLNLERILVDEARAAYAHGSPTTALSALARHQREYPQGALTEEREALAIRILVDSGNQPEARRRGAQFRTRYPNSLMRPAVDAALESIP